MQAVRGTFADRREAGHRRAGREDYQFRLGGDTVIDATQVRLRPRAPCTGSHAAVRVSAVIHATMATQAGGMARYINHSCAPNCAAAQCSVDGRLHLGIFATRAIAEGEELTYDYKVRTGPPCCPVPAFRTVACTRRGGAAWQCGLAPAPACLPRGQELPCVHDAGRSQRRVQRST